MAQQLVLFGLFRNGQWISKPKRTNHKKIVWDNLTGDILWAPGLSLGKPENAWLTNSLELALERAAILRVLPKGYVVQVTRWVPYE